MNDDQTTVLNRTFPPAFIRKITYLIDTIRISGNVQLHSGPYLFANYAMTPLRGHLLLKRDKDMHVFFVLVFLG